MLQGNHGGFELYNPTAGITPIYVKTGINGYSLVVDDAGRVGVGAFTPEAALHVLRSNGTARLYVQENSAVSSPRTLLDLRNFGRPEIVMGNTSTGGEWSFGAGTNFILKQGAVGSASSAKTKLFEVKSNGDATLTGTLTTGGTTCGGGCDLVFSDDYDLPSIAEHTERMFALGHLPNVGPTSENEPINVSDKLGRMLNELEHAHIYIARQQEQMARMQAEIDALKAARH
ncbi:hypothetical protein [Marimonas arenosa]|uniref:Uncharacterized protein n=1 Tax=Marimonas arenosa TaxID=1795305 RepID=A0AAE3WHH2_9RHOB|nr:hypothetical protein [Marimonas arenosa]MDQ2091907.1 hypothetical protein [Marimonas arenosa]